METNLKQRKIIHIDMDAFYASVEELDNPALKKFPVAVGGNSERGVVSTANYKARTFGVKSAMSGKLAKKLCPDLIFVPPRFERYKEISHKIRSIYFEYTDLVEPLSLDEAYLDVTFNKKNISSASKIAREIRSEIFKKTELNASAGISVNKFIAKVASDINKPNGQKTIPPEEVIEFLEKLEIRKFYGIGKVTTQKMYHLGIFTGNDLKSKSLEFLEKNFGKSGNYYYNVVRGIHNSEVKTERLRKSVGAEHTYIKNINSEIEIEEKLVKIAEEVANRLERNKLAGKTITLKIKYSDFSIQTRSQTTLYFISNKDLIYDVTKNLLLKEKVLNSVRLLGISVSNLNNQIKKETTNISPKQLTFKF